MPTDPTDLTTLPAFASVAASARYLESAHELEYGHLVSVRLDLSTGAIQIRTILPPGPLSQRLPGPTVTDERQLREREWADVRRTIHS